MSLSQETTVANEDIDVIYPDVLEHVDDASFDDVNTRLSGGESSMHSAALHPISIFETVSDERPSRGAPSTSSSVPPIISSRLQVRKQLRQRFIDLHFGTAGQPFQIFVCEMMQVNGENDKAMQAAMDTLCIAQLATSFRDQTLAKTSHIMYTQCMVMLNHIIRRFARYPSDDLLEDMMGCAHILIPLAWFICVEPGAHDWVVHTRSLLKIYETQRWEQIVGPFTDFCHSWWKELTLLQHLDLTGKARRRSMSATMDGDVGMSFFVSLPASMAGDDETSFFASYASEVAALLQRSDDMINSVTHNLPQQDDVFELLTALGKMVSVLKRWQLQYVAASPGRYREVSIRSFPHMRSFAGQHLNTFPIVYNFNHAVHERDYRACIISLLNLQVATLGIYDSVRNLWPFNEMTELQIQAGAARYDATDCADALCMLVPWSTQPQNQTLGAIYAFKALQLATKYYAKHGMDARLAWCSEVTKSLSAKYGISVQLLAGP